MSRWSVRLVVACCSLAPACGEDAGGNWSVDDPPRHAFTDETTPHMEASADESTWPDAPLPLTEVGADTGEPGIVLTAAMCGYYQMRMQDADHGFRYEYDPRDDSFNDEDNVHRKAVSTFSLTWLYGFTRRDEFRFGAERGLLYLVDLASEEEDGSLRLRDLGATSLVVMALTQHAYLSGTTAWDDEIDRFGAYLLTLIEPDGSFNSGGPLSYAQAHLALWRLYDHTKDEVYLDALESVGQFFYEHRDDDAWIDSRHLYGLWAHEPLTELYGVRPHAWLPEFVFEVADSVVDGQYTPLDDVPPEWIGGFREDGDAPTWRTILKLEGTIDAYRMADWAGDEEHARIYRRSALIATQFLQSLQFRAGDTDGYPAPARALGGTPFEFDDPIVRIEVPGHMVNAILKVVEYLDLEDYPGRDP